MLLLLYSLLILMILDTGPIMDFPNLKTFVRNDLVMNTSPFLILPSNLLLLLLLVMGIMIVLVVVVGRQGQGRRGTNGDNEGRVVVFPRCRRRRRSPCPTRPRRKRRRRDQGIGPPEAVERRRAEEDTKGQQPQSPPHKEGEQVSQKRRLRHGRPIDSDGEGWM